MAVLIGSFLAAGVVWGVLAWLAIAFYTTLIATAKNLWSFWWFVGAILFGPVALIAVVGMPVKEKVR